MYNFSSSVNDLAPAPKHVLKLGYPLNNQRGRGNEAYTQAFVFQQSEDYVAVQ